MKTTDEEVQDLINSLMEILEVEQLVIISIDKCGVTELAGAVLPAGLVAMTMHIAEVAKSALAAERDSTYVDAKLN
ncbi:MAG: hypothetical protein WCY49_07080 [Anaerovoracaceae bacterium]